MGWGHSGDPNAEKLGSSFRPSHHPRETWVARVKTVTGTRGPSGKEGVGHHIKAKPNHPSFSGPSRLAYGWGVREMEPQKHLLVTTPSAFPMIKGNPSIEHNAQETAGEYWGIPCRERNPMS